MSGIINQTALNRYAGNSAIEVRGGSDGAAPTETAGSWAGRLWRNLTLIFGSGPSAAERTANTAAKNRTLAELQATFGQDIGTRAFRAHIGKSDGQDGWMSSSAHPITGRHITRMVETAHKLKAAEYDHSRMQQISVGGMAGPLSKGVCKAATVEWFRRIDNGQRTWRHDASGPLLRASVDWQAKRERLQAIQAGGQSADPQQLFRDRIYVAQQPLHSEPVAGKVGLDTGQRFADQLFASARERFAPGSATAHDDNQFWQINVTLAGRVQGSIDHATGIHVTRVPGSNTDTPADFRVRVFDANARETVEIPGERFGTWLSSHMTDQYGDRVRRMDLADVTKQHPDAPL
ncbi:MAG: hypothetical protein JOY81_03670 [Alphaproteobacteria bacterium]|nr:hypothetical protein [Alphaproteobacteria bacterium]